MDRFWSGAKQRINGFRARRVKRKSNLPLTKVFGLRLKQIVAML